MEHTLGEKRKKSSFLLLILYTVYILLLFWVVIFKAEFSLPPVRASRTINFIPFYNGGAEIARIPVFDSVANVLVFIPFGVYLKKLGIGSLASVVTGACLSLFFEATQLAFAIGVSDITDLMTNTAGTALGVGAYLLAVRLAKKHRRLDKFLKISVFTVTCLALVFFLLLLAINLI